MPDNAYHFITTWNVEGTRQEVNDIIGDARDLPRWWPSVYLDVQQLEPGDESGLGKVVSLYTKGWLPYTLRWKFKVTAADRPHGFSLSAIGDFVGTGVWRFTPDGENGCEVVYDWKITAEKPLLKLLTPLLRPLFSANHHWAMRMGEKSLKLELKRQRAKTDAERMAVPPPPGPTFPHNLINF